MVTTKLNLSMTEPQVRQIYAKQGDTGRVLDITLDQTPEDGTLRILRPDGVEVTSEAVTGGEVESGGTFESLAEADVTELTVGIEPVQDLKGYDKPWVGGAGKNLYVESPNFTGYTNSSRWALQSETYDGNPVMKSASAYYGLYKNVYLGVGTYTFSCMVKTSDSSLVSIYSISNNVEGHAIVDKTTKYTETSTSWTKVSITFSVTTAGYASCRVERPSSGDIYVSEYQIELGSTATAWQPYSNICPITGHDEVEVYFGAEQGTADETYTASLGQTVYGGTLDVVSGELVVDRAMVDLGTLSWGMSGSGNTAFFYANTSALGIASDITTTLNYICENYSIVPVSSGGTETGIAFTSASQLRIRDATYNDATSFKTAMNGVQLVYELASPQTYQLTPQQIKTLVGTNNVWASSGDVVSIKFTYGGLFSELPSDATSIVGKCYCDVEQNGVSSMPFTLNVKKNERQ